MTDRDAGRDPWGPLVGQAQGDALRTVTNATAAVKVAASAVLGILTPLRDARSRRIPPLCRCQYADNDDPPYER